MSAQLSGVITSLVTPFGTVHGESGSAGEIDTLHFEVLVRRQSDAGVAAVAVAGWVGEGPTLTDRERRLLVETAVRAKGAMKVLVHVGTPSTARSLALALDANVSGADGLILVVPFYNRPNHAGIRRHVATVAASTSLPLYIEIDEATTNVHLTVAQIAELSRIERVVGIVDHTANPLHVECMSSARRGTSFFAAYEQNAMVCGLLGADGIFSASANVSPALVTELWAYVASNDVPRARMCHERLQPLFEFTRRHGVAGLKYLLQPSVGSEPSVRLPLCELESLEECDRPALAAVCAPASVHRTPAR